MFFRVLTQEFSELVLEIDPRNIGKEYTVTDVGYPIKLVDGVYYLHCESGDCVVPYRDGKHMALYYEGTRCRIEDMHWSDEDKVIAKLKYGECSERFSYNLNNINGLGL